MTPKIGCNFQYCLKKYLPCCEKTYYSVTLLQSDRQFWAKKTKRKGLKINRCLQLALFMSHTFSNICVNIFNNPSSFISPARESEQQKLLKGPKLAFYRSLWHSRHINLLSNTCCCIYTLRAPCRLAVTQSFAEGMECMWLYADFLTVNINTLARVNIQVQQFGLCGIV